MSEPDRDGCVRLSFPVSPAYVSSARLTAASIANRQRFDIDEIEDIKTAVSEACTYIIRTLSDARGSLSISFLPEGDRLDIAITVEGTLADTDADDMGLVMIRAMMDDFTLDRDADGGLAVRVRMGKRHKASIFR